MSAAGKRHLARVVTMGCIACRKIFGSHVLTPAEAHHVREGRRPRNDEEVLPFCPPHHRTGNGDPEVKDWTIHFHKRALLAAMGAISEQELLDEINFQLLETTG